MCTVRCNHTGFMGRDAYLRILRTGRCTLERSGLPHRADGRAAEALIPTTKWASVRGLIMKQQATKAEAKTFNSHPEMKSRGQNYRTCCNQYRLIQ